MKDEVEVVTHSGVAFFPTPFSTRHSLKTACKILLRLYRYDNSSRFGYPDINMLCSFKHTATVVCENFACDVRYPWWLTAMRTADMLNRRCSMQVST